MADEAKLTVMEGVCRGRRFTVPPGDGIRIGRELTNDVPIEDPSVSRFHCRVFFKPNGTLWVADLGSANETLVNGKAAPETQLSVGDTISVGDTMITVDSVGSTAVPLPGDGPIARPSAPRAAPVDLGLGRKSSPASVTSRPGRKLIIVVGALAAAAVLVAVIYTLLDPSKGGGDDDNGGHVVSEKINPAEFDLVYDRVDGSESNLCWARFEIEAGKVKVRVVDLENGREVTEPYAEVNEEDLLALAKDLRDSGFFDLAEAYEDRAPLNVHKSRTLSVTTGLKTHRVTVKDTIPPEPFTEAADALERFARNEFPAIGGITKTREELVELAVEQMTLADRLYAERNVHHENLYRALTAYREVVAYLETVDPKPEGNIYATAAANANTCRDELERRCIELKFQADHAKSIGDWDKAATLYETILATVVDQSDQRYIDAHKELLDVQRRAKR